MLVKVERNHRKCPLEKKKWEYYDGFTEASRQTFTEHTVLSANKEGRIMQHFKWRLVAGVEMQPSWQGGGHFFLKVERSHR